MITFDGKEKIIEEKNDKTGIEKTSVINDNGSKMKIMRDTRRGIVRIQSVDVEGRTSETRDDPNYTRYKVGGKMANMWKLLRIK